MKTVPLRCGRCGKKAAIAEVDPMAGEVMIRDAAHKRRVTWPDYPNAAAARARMERSMADFHATTDDDGSLCWPCGYCGTGLLLTADDLRRLRYEHDWVVSATT